MRFILVILTLLTPLLAVAQQGTQPAPISISGSRTWTNSAGVLVPFPSSAIPVTVVGITMTSATNLSARGVGFIATDANGGEYLGTFGSGLNFSGGILTASGGSGSSVAAGTNVLIITNGFLLTISGVTDTNSVNGLLGAVTNGGILNLSNYTLTISQNATNEALRQATSLTNGAINNLTNYAFTLSQNGSNYAVARISGVGFGTILTNLTAWTSFTNQGFSAIGVVTNDANGKTYTTPILPPTLQSTNAVIAAGANVTVTTNFASGVVTYTITSAAGGSGTGIQTNSGTGLNNIFTNGSAWLSFTNQGIAGSPGIVTNDAGGKLYSAFPLPQGAVDLTYATNESVLLTQNTTNYAIARNAGTGTNTTIKGDSTGVNALFVDASGVRITNGSGGIYATGNVLYASGQSSFAGITNRAFSAIGVVTNDALGNLYTTPTLSTILAPGSNDVVLAGSGVTVTTNYVTGGVTYSVAATGGTGIATNSGTGFNNNLTNLTAQSSFTTTNAASGWLALPTGTNITFYYWGTNSAGTLQTNKLIFNPGSLGTAFNLELSNTNSVDTFTVTQDGWIVFGTNKLALISTNGIGSFAGLTNTSFTAIGVVTNDANGKEYTTPVLPPPLLNLLNATNNDTLVTNYASLVVGVGATNEALRQATSITNGAILNLSNLVQTLSQNDTNYAIARNAGTGTNTTIKGDSYGTNGLLVSTSNDLIASNSLGSFQVQSGNGRFTNSSTGGSFRTPTNLPTSGFVIQATSTAGDSTWTAVQGVTIPNTITPTNFIVNTRYTNSSGSIQLVDATIALITASVAGAASMDLMADQAGGTAFVLQDRVAISTLLTGLTINYTNALSGALSNNATYYFTNTSSGAGNSSVIVPTTGELVTLADGGAANVVTASTTITLNGTPNQITSSAGAQDLSANRTWTLSLPSTLAAPGSITSVGFSNSSSMQISSLIITNPGSSAASWMLGLASDGKTVVSNAVPSGGGGGGTNSGPITLLAVNNQVNIPCVNPVGVVTNSVLPFRLTLTNNFTITNATGMVDDQAFRLTVIQDGTGGRTLSWWGAFTNGSPTFTSYGSNSFGREITGVNISTNANSISKLMWRWYAPGNNWQLEADLTGY